MKGAGDTGFRIVSLDGIRAIAALIVFVSHNGLEDRVPGGFGVTIFFFLSGYLITTLLRLEYEKTSHISLPKFYLRRAFRILPPFYIVLLLSAVAPFGHLGPETTAGGILAQVAQLTNYYLVFFGQQHLIPLTVFMWSLAVEEHFYLLFPLALRSLLRRTLDYRRIGLVLAAVCGVVFLWRCVLVFGLGLGEHYTYYATDTRLDSLLFGCIMGIWLNPALDRQCLALKPRVWAMWVAAGGALLLFTLLYRNAQFRETFRYSLQGVALFPLFFCAVRYSEWPIFRWLEHPWMRGLGLISYTFYLAHEKCLGIAGRLVGASPIPRALLGFVLTIAFSTAMYFLIERRMARLRRRLHKDTGVTPRPAAAAPTT